MHQLTTTNVPQTDIDSVLKFYTMEVEEAFHDIHQFYLQYEEWWGEGIDEDLPGREDSGLREAFKNGDYEVLAREGFGNPLFFYDIVETYHLAFADNPAKGGFSCVD